MRRQVAFVPAEQKTRYRRVSRLQRQTQLPIFSGCTTRKFRTPDLMEFAMYSISASPERPDERETVPSGALTAASPVVRKNRRQATGAGETACLPMRTLDFHMVAGCPPGPVSPALTIPSHDLPAAAKNPAPSSPGYLAGCRPAGNKATEGRSNSYFASGRRGEPVTGAGACRGRMVSTREPMPPEGTSWTAKRNWFVSGFM